MEESVQCFYRMNELMHELKRSGVIRHHIDRAIELLELSKTINEKGYSARLKELFERGMISGVKVNEHSFRTLTPTVETYRTIAAELLSYYSKNKLIVLRKAKRRYEKLYNCQGVIVPRKLSSHTNRILTGMKAIMKKNPPEYDFKKVHLLIEEYYSRNIFFVLSA